MASLQVSGPPGVKDGARCRIVINAANLTGAGARDVGLSLLPPLLGAMPEADFCLLLPDQESFRRLGLESRATVRYFPVRSGLANDVSRLWQIWFEIPRLCRSTGADLCFTLGDIGPGSLGACAHVVYLHQALLVYSSDELRGLRGWSPVKRWYLENHFRRMIRRGARVVVQTGVVGERLSRRYGVVRSRIDVVPVPVPRHLSAHIEEGFPAIAESGRPVRLLFLARAYPHKNHAILPKLVEELRCRGMAERVHIFLTLDAETLPPKLRRQLEECRDVVVNLGPLGSESVGRALRTSTAMFMPTIVESLSLVYLEAMATGTPVLTSDRDFARVVCGEQATYFDPHDPRSIADAIEHHSMQDPTVKQAATVPARFTGHPKDWNEVAERLRSMLERAQGARGAGA